MRPIHGQNDLASLPEPCFICTAPTWLRWFAAGLLTVGAVMAGTVALNGLNGGRDLPVGIGGVIVAAFCLFVLLRLRPLDWRVWINLAASRDGLYLVVRARRVVFVPWADVIGLEIVRKTGQPFARLTLRLPDEGWTRFGNTPGISGTGPVRRYALPSLVMPGDKLVETLNAFRAAHAA